ncbi:hypothetical protein ACQBAR_10765 [Propionibacteriaceae bacterium Y1685]
MSDHQTGNEASGHPEQGGAEENERAQQAAQAFDTQASNPSGGGPDRLAGGMGVSSERTGETGPGQHGTDGVRATDSTATSDAEADDNPVDPGQRPDPTTRF